MTPNVVLGLGGTVDYELEWDASVLEDLVREHGIGAGELSTDVTIATERDLVRSILAFVRDGAGGERFVASSEVVEAFAARFALRVTLGGTCVRAALAMARVGLPSTVHLVSIDDHVRRLLPAEVSYLCSADHDSTDPHLIVQYPRGARVRAGDVDVSAARANRLIYVNDLPNRELVLSPDLGGVLRDAAVLLVSGFNTIQDPAVLEARLADLRRHLRSLPPDALVVYEDAGFHLPELRAPVRSALVDVVDVHSLNEDEMQGYLGRRLDLLDAPTMAVALRELHDLVPARTLVVHTTSWALALGEAVERYRPALQGGITMASARYLHGDAFTAGDHAAVEGLPRHAGGRAFAAELEGLLPGEVACVPAFVLDTPTPTTIGLGDTFVGGFLAALVRARAEGPDLVGEAAHRLPVGTAPEEGAHAWPER